MPTFKLNRDYTLRSVLGHSVVFKKGEETYVPPTLAAECVRLGAEQIDGVTDVLGEVPVQVMPPTGDARETALFAAFAAMISDNIRDEFTGAGAPQVAAVEKRAGFGIDARERDSAWQEYRQKQAA